MAVYIRLDDAVRARLRGDGGCTSSGSDHDASACLSDLVQAFLETDAASAGDEAAGPAPKGQDGFDSDDADGAAEAAASVRELLDPPAAEDPFRIRLAAAVSAALDAEAPLRGHGAAFRRAVMRRLRSAGYDAGVCRSRWETCGNLTAGTYEYIDVVVPGTSTSTTKAARGSRYIVDADFRAGLEVARATADYAVVVAAVPAKAVVAREEAVGHAVRVAADAARRSLRSHGLHVPPWRKSRYMLAKWLGPYKRSPSTSSPASGAMPAPGATGMDIIKCRAVGFFPSQTAAPAARIK